MGADFGLGGKVALVTGGNSGIGRSIVLAFAAAGAKVAIVSRDAERNAAVAAEAGDGCAGYSVDVGDADAVAEVVAAVHGDFGGLDILVNNAGMALASPVVAIDVESFQRVMDVNLTSALVASREFAQRAGAGKIINVLSEYATFGAAFLAGYAASKHALAGLTKTMAIEMAPRIQVNAIQPGWIETPLTQPARENADMNAEILLRTPMGRWGHPDECAGAAVYLASPASDFVNGAVVTVDGGYRIR